MFENLSLTDGVSNFSRNALGPILVGVGVGQAASSQHHTRNFSEPHGARDNPSNVVMESTELPVAPAAASEPIPVLYSRIKSLSAQRALVKLRLEPNYDDYLIERQGLMKKKRNSSLSRVEELRLKQLDHNLDLIEDARDGQQLDQIEAMTSAYRVIASSIFALADEVSVEQEQRDKVNRTKSQFGPPTK